MLTTLTDFNLRPLDPSDYPLAVEVYRGCADFLALGPDPNPSLEMLLKDIALSERSGSRFCGVWLKMEPPDGERLVGVVDYQPSGFMGEAAHAFIELLMVAAPFRRQGLGRRVFALVEELIHLNPAVTAVFLGVQVNNPSAQRFWRSAGFHIVSGPELQADGTTTYLMRKALRPPNPDLTQKLPGESPITGLDLTPEQFRQLGYQAIDLIAASLERLQSRQEPARRAVPPALRDQLMHQPLPIMGSDPAALLDFFAQNIQPYPLGHNNPRFFAWVNSPAAPLSILGELLAAGMNSSTAGGDQASTYLELAVLDWLKQIMGFPQESGAILVSGGSMATTVGLAVMRFVKAQSGNVRGRGLQAEDSPMVVYTSSEGHSCIEKAVELLGFGHDYLRRIPVDNEFRMDTAALEQQIRIDRQAGLRPVCVAASAGTVNTGAIDPLAQIADICRVENLWFHVDGAYGGVAILAEQTHGLYAGIERADSLGIDPHKWLYVPVECGCAIVRDRQAMRNTFSAVPPYLRDDRQLPWFSEFGPQQTRGFRALKLWLALQQIGVEGYKQLISRDIQLAHLLRQKLRSRSTFELLSDGPLSATCFRYAPGGITNLDALNKALLSIVQARGLVYLTSTQVRGAFALRANIVNFRTNEQDLDVLLDEIEQAGNQIIQGANP